MTALDSLPVEILYDVVRHVNDQYTQYHDPAIFSLMRTSWILHKLAIQIYFENDHRLFAVEPTTKQRPCDDEAE